MCGLFLFAPLEGVAQKFTVFRKSLSCTIFEGIFVLLFEKNRQNLEIIYRICRKSSEKLVFSCFFGCFAELECFLDNALETGAKRIDLSLGIE